MARPSAKGLKLLTALEVNTLKQFLGIGKPILIMVSFPCQNLIDTAMSYPTPISSTVHVYAHSAISFLAYTSLESMTDLISIYLRTHLQMHTLYYEL